MKYTVKKINGNEQIEGPWFASRDGWLVLENGKPMPLKCNPPKFGMFEMYERKSTAKTVANYLNSK